MSNASLKEQLQAMVLQLTDAPKPTSIKPARVNLKQKARSAQQKPKWLDYVQYGVELLRVYFPHCFKMTNAIQPLQKGIKEELIKRLSALEQITTEDKACMVKSLAYYVNLAAYHRSMQAGVMRIDLDGNPIEAVTVAEAQYALARQQAKQLAKSKAKADIPTS